MGTSPRSSDLPQEHGGRSRRTRSAGRAGTSRQVSSEPNEDRALLVGAESRILRARALRPDHGGAVQELSQESDVSGSHERDYSLLPAGRGPSYGRVTARQLSAVFRSSR